ncbi:metal transporter [Parashewanella curva]|uniref:Metal transporter n=1 Tax=Parashewanella curva TaxID=2338552 RepID=A0A3L8Q2S7_9GAMM|nr:metal transporter [Parashewanella curva]RLV60792.1 metal transporter [Parashewanella curva]
MLYLVASLIALLAGPVCYRVLSSGSALQKGLDGFIFVSLGGLVLIHILPQLLEHGSWLALLFVAIGMWGPTMSERIFHRHSELTHNLTLTLGVGGLLLHTLTDGGALVLAQQPENSTLLALGIILHRLPVGIAMWWLLKPQVGSRWAALVLGLMMLLTTVGYLLGEQFLTHISLDNTVYLQAFVTGSILHVVLHQPHVEKTEDPQGQFEYHAGVGSILGIGLLLILMLTEMGELHQHDVEHELTIFWHWVIEILPLILLTLALGILRQNLEHRLPVKLRNSQLQGFTPEAVFFTLVILGWAYALFQLLLSLAMSMLSVNRSTEFSEKNGLSLTIIDSNAAVVIFSLLLVNILGQPTGLLSIAAIQVLLLLPLFVVCRFTLLGSSILAASLAFQQWHILAVMGTLILPPLLTATHLKYHLKPLMLGAIAITIGYWLLPNAMILPTTEHHDSRLLIVISAALIAVLCSISLFRLGPREFLKRMWGLPERHHHHH